MTWLTSASGLCRPGHHKAQRPGIPGIRETAPGHKSPHPTAGSAGLDGGSAWRIESPRSRGQPLRDPPYPRTGKDGWVPAVRGGWRKGMRHQDAH